jgi:1-aminocyclopropane-1-carboxylate deaminase/D-cysteine desulfhydrase-like pyridoxal-dependent ACC family enzyme
VDPFLFDGKPFFVKRDDLVDPRYSGNKLRKLHALLQSPSSDYDTLISYGGAQSNAMLSISYLARSKGWRFLYYAKKLPAWLKKAPAGNLAGALAQGMELIEVPHESFYDEVEKAKRSCGAKERFIPQGGADMAAKEGVRILADEILAWMAKSGVASCTVATPSGTGTTALFLRRHLPSSVEVVTTPVVGDEETLRNQWKRLEPSRGNLPRILHTTGRHPFAKPRPDYLEIWRRLAEAGIGFDLVYAPKMWLELLAAYETLPKPLLYVHSGGLAGNESQLERYRRMGLA